MASRVQQDTFIDDSDETCPLCVEEFDLSDRNFRPCPCGYQVCQFCFNNIRSNMNGLCPACRRPYDEKTIEWKVVSPEEFKADVQKQARKKAEIRQKEAQKREVESLNRKHLSGLRVVQKNLVYVVGLNPRIREEDLLQTLRGEQYFGQYGKIVKIVVSKAKEGTQGSQPLGVYVTFARVQDAERCIAAVDGSENGGRTLRAQFGTTKYCSAYLRNETCPNKNCMFLHEPGEEKDSFTRQDLSSINVVSTQRPAAESSASSDVVASSQPTQSTATVTDHTAQPPPQATRAHGITAASQPMGRQASRDDTASPVDSGDGSALPSSASWATRGIHLPQSRTTSQAASIASPSPMVSKANLSSQSREASHGEDESESVRQQESQMRALPLFGPANRLDRLPALLLDAILKSASSPAGKFCFSKKMFSAEDYNAIANFPPLLDPDGGAKRRAAREREQERERQRERERERELELQQEQEQLSQLERSEAIEGPPEEVPGSGSLQLGGEPEDEHGADSTGHGNSSAGPDAQLRAVGPPSQQMPVSAAFHGLGFGPPQVSDPLAGLSRTSGRFALSQPRFPMMRSGEASSSIFSNQAPQGLSTSSSQQLPLGLFQNQTGQLGPPGHARQSSRYSFANDSASASAAVKPAAHPKLMAQQSAMMPSGAIQAHQTFGGPFYGGAAQGPPPGLKSAGTPPLSGDGMFSQGHGFAPGLGGIDDKTELLRNVLRSRGGQTGAGGLGQASEAGKREYHMFPSLLQASYPSSSNPSPAPVLSGPSSFFGGAHLGAFQDLGPPKPKKNKGKKHRHANTSSSGGGGIVNLADPSMLQARMHQQQAAGSGNAATGGSAFFGGGGGGVGGGQGQGQDPLLPLFNEKTKSIGGVIRDEAKVDTAVGDALIGAGIDTRGAIINPPPGLTNPLDRSAAGNVSKGTTVKPSTQITSDVVASPATLTPISPIDPNIPATIPIEDGSPLGKGKGKEKVVSESSTAPSVVRSLPATISVPSGSPSVAGGPRPDARSSIEATQRSKPGSEPLMRFHPGKLNLVEAAKRPSRDGVPAHAPAPAAVRTSIPVRSVSSANVPSPLTINKQDFPALTPASTSSQVGTRSLRIVPSSVVTSKTDPSPSLPVVASAIHSPMTRNPSRQPSIASLGTNRPATPHSVSEMTTSDNASYTSTSVSRANSPPPLAASRVGSAPVRTQTKSQQKKQRKETKKEMEMKALDDMAAASKAKPAEDQKRSEEEAAREIAPIIGRKKKLAKFKKTPDRSEMEASTSGSTSRPVSASGPAGVDSTAEVIVTAAATDLTVKAKTTNAAPTASVKGSASGEPKAGQIASHTSGSQTNKARGPDASSLATVPSVPDAPHPLTPAALLSELSQSLVRDLTQHPFFNPPPTSHSYTHQHHHPSQPSQLLLHSYKPPSALQLSTTENEALANGLPVHQPAKATPTPTPTATTPSSTSTQPVSKTARDKLLITPSGYLLRGLSDEQEQKFLVLEQEINKIKGVVGTWTAPVSDGRASGLDDANAIIGGEGALRFAATEAGNTRDGVEERTLIDVPALEKMLCAARKETEVIEKRLAGLVRRNRKLGFTAGVAVAVGVGIGIVGGGS